MDEEVVDPIRLQRLYAKARSDLLEKDEAMKKLSARLRAMEEGAAKLKVQTQSHFLKIIHHEAYGIVYPFKGTCEAAGSVCTCSSCLTPSRQAMKD
jgi:fido (protein-threonine AMPylation protein)